MSDNVDARVATDSSVDEETLAAAEMVANDGEVYDLDDVDDATNEMLISALEQAGINFRFTSDGDLVVARGDAERADLIVDEIFGDDVEDDEVRVFDTAKLEPADREELTNFLDKSEVWYRFQDDGDLEMLDSEVAIFDAFVNGAPINPTDRIVTLTTVPSSIEAQTVSEMLRSNGFNAQVYGDRAFSWFPYLEFTSGVRVVVPESQYDDALDVLDSEAI